MHSGPRSLIVIAALGLGLLGGTGCSSDSSKGDAAPGGDLTRTRDATIWEASSSSDSKINKPSGQRCEAAGGNCGCSCGDPFPIDAPEHNDCPQPCATCGACSQFCCLPDPDCDATRGCIKLCQGDDCECQCPPEETPCDDATCDRPTQVCVGKGPVGPSVFYACEALPPSCDLARTCACMAGILCNAADTCSEEDEDNTIFCDNGTQ